MIKKYLSLLIFPLLAHCAGEISEYTPRGPCPPGFFSFMIKQEQQCPVLSNPSYWLTWLELIQEENQPVPGLWDRPSGYKKIHLGDDIYRYVVEIPIQGVKRTYYSKEYKTDYFKVVKITDVNLGSQPRQDFGLSFNIPDLDIYDPKHCKSYPRKCRIGPGSGGGGGGGGGGPTQVYGWMTVWLENGDSVRLYTTWRSGIQSIQDCNRYLSWIIEQIKQNGAVLEVPDVPDAVRPVHLCNGYRFRLLDARVQHAFTTEY